MTSFLKPFEPITAGTLKPSLSTTATTAASLPDSCDTVVISNTDTSIVIFWRCQRYDPVLLAPTVTAVADVDLPVLPGQQIRISVPKGPKKYSIVAASGTPIAYVTPGIGN